MIGLSAREARAGALAAVASDWLHLQGPAAAAEMDFSGPEEKAMTWTPPVAAYLQTTNPTKHSPF